MFRQLNGSKSQHPDKRNEHAVKLEENFRQHQFQNVISIAEDIHFLFANDKSLCSFAYQFSAAAKARLGDLNGALYDANRALSFDKSNGEAYTARAAAKYGLGNFRGAIDDADLAVNLSPLTALGYSIRSEAKRALNEDMDHAINDAGIVSAMVTTGLLKDRFHSKYEIADARMMRAAAKRLQGDAAFASQDETEANNLVPALLPYLFKTASEKAYCYETLKEDARSQDIKRLYEYFKNHQFQRVINKAASILASYVSDTAMHVTAYHVSAAAKVRVGDFQGALHDADNALKLDQYDAEAYIARAAAKFSLGNYNGAIVDSDAAIKRRPFSAYAYVIRAEAKRVNHNMEGAIKDAQCAVNFTSSENYRHTFASKFETFDTADALLLRAAAKKIMGYESAAQQDEKDAEKLVAKVVPLQLKNPYLITVNRRQSNIFVEELAVRQRMIDDLSKREDELALLLRMRSN